MTDLEKIIVTACFTVGGAVLVYVSGEILSKFYIEPLYNLRKTIGEVRFNLGFHGATIHTPIGRTKEKSDKAMEALLESSCKLIAQIHAVPLYGVTRFTTFKVLPKRNAIESAAVQLRGLSTYLHEKGEKAFDSLDVIRNRVFKIEKLLGLKSLE